MSLTVKFELADEDLEHFRTLMQEACAAAAGRSEAEIVDAAQHLLEQVRASNAPRFVLERLGRLETLIEVLRDEEWRLPADERGRVVNALGYFCHPEGLIPDHVPGLGFLDDAIMIELVGYELQHEIEAYADFCDFRTKEAERRVKKSGSEAKAEKVTRADWLSAKRSELRKRARKEAGGLGSLFSLFTG